VKVKIEDPLKRINPQNMATLCQSAGLPLPEAVMAIGSPTRHQIYGLKFPASAGVPSHVLRLDLVSHPRGTPTDHMLAASNVLKLVDSIPCRQDGRRVADQVFGCPAGLYQYVELSTAQELIVLQSSFWETAAQHLGQTLAALADHPVPYFGVRARDGRFLPSRRSWREEWLQHVYALNAGAEAMGLDYGPLSQRALQAIQQRQESLDEVQDFHLIHGQLRLKNLEYLLKDGQPEFVNLAGFDHAMLGDHLVEVGYLLSMEAPELGPILAAYGHDRVQSWLQPDALARIEMYAMSLALTRPAEIASHILMRGQTDVINALELARTYLEQTLEPDFAKTRIELALQHPQVAPTPQAGPQPDPGRTTLRRSVACLRGDAVPLATQAPLLCVTLGASTLAVEVESDPIYAKVLGDIAPRLLTLFPGLGVSWAVQPIADRTEWRKELLQHIVEAADRASGASGNAALMLAWLGFSAIDKLEGTVSDSVLRGLESLLREMAIHDVRNPPGNDILRLQHAVTGRAAMGWLEQSNLGIDEATLDELAARLDDRIQDLVDLAHGTEIPTPTDQFSDETLLPYLIDASASQEQQLTRPLLVLALRSFHGKVTMPANAQSLIRHMGG